MTDTLSFGQAGEVGHGDEQRDSVRPRAKNSIVELLAGRA